MQARQNLPDSKSANKVLRKIQREEKPGAVPVEILPPTSETDSAFQPFFQSRSVSAEIKTRQTVPEHKKWVRYYERWGCLLCGTREKEYESLGMCLSCHTRTFMRLKAILRELVPPVDATKALALKLPPPLYPFSEEALQNIAFRRMTEAANLRGESRDLAKRERLDSGLSNDLKALPRELRDARKPKQLKPKT